MNPSIRKNDLSSKFNSPKASSELSFSDWKRLKDGIFNKPTVNPVAAVNPVRNNWNDDSFETYAPPMQPLPPPTWANRKKETKNPEKQTSATESATSPNKVKASPNTKYIARPTDNTIAPPPPPPLSITKLVDPPSTALASVATLPRRLQPQIYVPRQNSFRATNTGIGPQRPGWIPKPPLPPPMHANTPESREEKQYMWRQYRQAMKPFKHKEFHNAKRAVQRLSKKPESELDEKERLRLQRALEVVTSHKTMLNERAIQRGLQVQAELEAAKAAMAATTMTTNSESEKRTQGSDMGKKEPASASSTNTTMSWLGNSVLDSSTADMVWR